MFIDRDSPPYEQSNPVRVPGSPGLPGRRADEADRLR
jgi:hypothetical protein